MSRTRAQSPLQGGEEVKLITPPDGLVLDPFTGSGTVLESAVLGGFRAVGVESDESYVALIRERLADKEEVSG